MIVRSAEYMQEPVPIDMLRSVLREFEALQPRLVKLREAYENKRDILMRKKEDGKPNNRLAHAFPRYIVTMSAGYLLGSAVTYSSDDQKEALDSVLDAYAAADVNSVDVELARQAAIYGKGVETVYANEQAKPRCAALDAERAFVVYSDDVEHRPLFGVSYIDKMTAKGTPDGVQVSVCTAHKIYTYRASSLTGIDAIESETDHYFGDVPIIEYWNDETESGDFEQVQSLIDAYDVLESDRVNDKEQFVDSILVMTGARLENEYRTVEVTDDQGNVTVEQELVSTPAQQIRKNKMLYLPDAEAKAEFLSRSMSETDVEVLKDALKSDIHKFSMIPDLTDQNFASNASGVAMRYKLLGLEQLTRIKEKWFREGLRQRLRLFAHFENIVGGIYLDADSVSMTFTRALPINELEKAQTLQAYQSLVPANILLKQVPFVENPDEAIKQLDQQKADAVERQREMFNGYKDINS